MTTASPVVGRVVSHSNNRRRGWVIATEDDAEAERPSSFDARKSAAAWNKGKGPSQASIPSRASSLASTPAPSPTISSDAFRPDTADQSTRSGCSTSTNTRVCQPVAPPRVPSASLDHNKDATSSSTRDRQTEFSSGRRRPSPPLLVPPKQTFRKVPSNRVLPAWALSDHQKFMAAANKASQPASPSSTASSEAASSPSRSPFVNAALRSELAKLAAIRRANSSSSSSTATTTSSASNLVSASTPATSVATAIPLDNQFKDKGKQVAQSPLQNDVQDFFSPAAGKVKQLAHTFDNACSREQSSKSQSSAPASTPSRPLIGNRLEQKQSLFFSVVDPLPALSEKSAASDLDDVLSLTSDMMSESEATNTRAARLTKRRDSLQIEMPPPPPQFKDRYPTIRVDSTHVSDSEASGTSKVGSRRRRRRSTTSTSNKLCGNMDDEDDDEYADDDSSWPSTPSTTPLEAYFTAIDAKPKPARRTVQTTKEIVAPALGALGMGRPMVVVTSPSTASEVSSDRRSSSGSGSTSDRTYSSSPPAVASVAPPAALTRIEEHVSAKSDAEPSPAAPPRRSLSFEVPAINRYRSSQESLALGHPSRSPSRAMAFLARISPSRSAARSSVDLASVTRTDAATFSTEAAKRMSLEAERRTSAEQRRSVELRPILLNAASRPPARAVAAEVAASGPTAATSTATTQQERRRSLGRVAVRPNVVPYHSRRSSEVSVGSSTESRKEQDRASFDKQAFDPRYSPASQVTTLTMPSPALSTEQKPFSFRPTTAVHARVQVDKRRSSSINAPNDRFAASMPSLHESAVDVHPRNRRSGSNDEAESRPSAIQLLVNSQKGRMTRDNDSIAEWISVSVHDLPLPNATEAYGNGGVGEFSKETQQQAKKPKKNRPWKLGRFAASEMLLPAKAPTTSAAAQLKRRSITLLKRASSLHVNEAKRTSTESTCSPHRGPFMRNLGFTTANRNVAMQTLCAERSILALAASTIYIAGCGRIKVPQPTPLPPNQSKATAKPKEIKSKKQSQNFNKPLPVPMVEKRSSPVCASQIEDASQDSYLNVKGDCHTGYDLNGVAVGTIRSMVPELGDWSLSTQHDRSPSQEVIQERPFRDYDDEGSDLFDSDGCESDSEDEMDDVDEDVEVPVRFGRRVNLGNRAGSGFYGLSVPATLETASAVIDQPSKEASDANGEYSRILPSVSLERIAPGTVVLHGAELRVCIEEEQLSEGAARPLAYWKALEVHQPRSKPDEPQLVENQVRRQPSSRAMKLEQEVATGMFAAFVGNRGPRRQAQRANSLAGTTGATQDPTLRGSDPRIKHEKELVVSKVNKSTFTVRSEIRSTHEGTEQVVEIMRRGENHLRQVSESWRESMRMDKLERTFPSPLLSNTEFAHHQSRSSSRTDSSRSILDDSAERIAIRIEPRGGRGFVASFQPRDGQHWWWEARKVEASVLSRSKKDRDVGGICVLENHDLVLRASKGSGLMELASYSADSQLRNALEVFKPRTKAIPKLLPNETEMVSAAVPLPTRVLPLAIPIRGGARREAPIPLRGIRGGPLVRPQPTATGMVRHHGLWQHARAAVSTEAVVQVHNNAVNNAVNNARASLQLDERPSWNPVRVNGPMLRSPDETKADEKLGVLSFSTVEAVDRDLVVLSLLAVMGSVKL